jgi:hypothetical protein
VSATQPTLTAVGFRASNATCVTAGKPVQRSGSPTYKMPPVLRLSHHYNSAIQVKNCCSGAIAATRVLEERILLYNPNPQSKIQNPKFSSPQRPMPKAITAAMLDAKTPNDVEIRAETRAPETDPSLGIPVEVNRQGTPRHRLAAIGDSLTHGFQNGALSNTSLSYPMLVAREPDFVGWVEERNPTKPLMFLVNSVPQTALDSLSKADSLSPFKWTEML